MRITTGYVPREGGTIAGRARLLHITLRYTSASDQNRAFYAAAGRWVGCRGGPQARGGGFPFCSCCLRRAALVLWVLAAATPRTALELREHLPCWQLPAGLHLPYGERRAGFVSDAALYLGAGCCPRRSGRAPPRNGAAAGLMTATRPAEGQSVRCCYRVCTRELLPCEGLSPADDASELARCGE